MTDEPARVELETPDLAAENRSALTALFPGLLADGVLDAAKLGELIDMPVAHIPDGRERYGLQWAGKQEAVRSLVRPSRGALRPAVGHSRDFDNASDVLIEGDNLEVLKLLQKAYNDRVAAIYVDPPYNTGQDFIYQDDFSDGLRKYLEYSGQLDVDGNRLSASADRAGRRHSRWLSMMYPRMVLARNLLAQDGVIFVSIDDNEVHNLRSLLDEVYGEENFLGILAVELSKTQGMKVSAAQNGQLVKNHEYVLVYARNAGTAYLDRMPLFDASEVYDDHYDIVWDGQESTRSLFQVLADDEKASSIFAQFGLKPNKVNLKKLLELDSAFHEYFVETYADSLFRESPIALDAIQSLRLEPGLVARHGKYILRANSRGKIVQLQAFADGVRRTDDYRPVRARATIRGALWKGYHSDMMNVGKEGGVEFKNGKKPVRLIEHLIKWTNRPKGLFMDFFAGSGTTGHAVLNLNRKDGGARHYLLVQLPEPVGDDSRTTVCDITRARLGNVLSSSPDAAGIKCFSLTDSNFRQSSNGTELDLFTSTLLRDQPDWQGVATEVLLNEGVALGEPWRRHQTADAEIVEADGVIVVLSLAIDDALVAAALSLRPRVLVFLEDGFADADAVKANAFTNAKNLGITMKTV